MNKAISSPSGTSNALQHYGLMWCGAEAAQKKSHLPYTQSVVIPYLHADK